MSVSLMIYYKDHSRQTSYYPFSFQEVLVKCWWPIARELSLPLLERLETLWIEERGDAVELVRELNVVRAYLDEPAPSPFKESAEYIRERIDQIIPIIERAIDEWDAIEGSISSN